ncbi:MAG: hypothetical protein QXO70_04500 [Candidatus Pacearchaeota archaeon]
MENNSEEVKKLENEKEALLKKLQEIENEKNNLFTRIIEIQGVLKYIKTKEKQYDK